MNRCNTGDPLKWVDDIIDTYYLGFSYKDTVADFSVMTTGEIEIVLANKECGALVFLKKEQVEKLRNFLNNYLDEQR